MTSERGDAAPAHTTLRRIAAGVLDAGPDAVLDLWSEVESVAAVRRIDPQMRADLLRRCDDLEQRDPALAAEIRIALDQYAPAVVADAHWRSLVPNQPSLGSFRGAFPRRDRIEVYTASEWLAENPRRLANVVVEARRFSSDERRVIEAIAILAEEAGIPDDIAEGAIAEGITEARRDKTVRSAR